MTVVNRRRRVDVIVVGGGSAGCALAARLAASGAKVELVEAGPALDDSDGRHGNAMNCDLSGRLDWGYAGRITAGRVAALPRGKVLGGSSVINTCIAMRPDPQSFAEWAVHGAGWEWERVLPAFRRLERDLDFSDAGHHGEDGPVPIVRWREDELVTASRVFRDAALAVGLPAVTDLNAPGASGVGALPMNREGRRRISAARAYLDPEALSELDISCGRLVDRVLFQCGRVAGIVSRGAIDEQVHPAACVALCAGAYATPAILLRSGIGPAEELERRGIPVIADLPGVGGGLMDHSQVHLVAHAPKTEPDGPALQALVRTTTRGSPIANDVQLCVLNRVDLERYAPGFHPDGGGIAMLCALLQHSLSTGTVKLASRDPAAPPDIEIDYVAHESDRMRYRHAIRLLGDIASRVDIAPLALAYGESPADCDDAALDDLVTRRVQTAHHPMGSARMGPESDPGAVVAPDLSVFGVEGLSVADASVIPVCVNANIHLTCTMIGERAAELLP